MKLSVDERLPGAVVEGRFLHPERPNKRNLTFVRDYAGTIGLADRISDVRMSAADVGTVTYKRLMAGEYLASGDFSAWKYNINLKPLGRPSAMAHVSWIGRDEGILFLDDIVPQLFGPDRSGVISLDVPDGWQVITSEPRRNGNTFDVQDVEKAVFVLTKTGGARTFTSGSVTTNIFGQWKFADDDAAAISTEILKTYSRLFHTSAPSAQVTIMRMPPSVSPGNWEADTRGSSVTILSSDMPFATQSVQRLHEQLRHELFHLWFPNGVDLTGGYDWFYEGFALYESLKTGVGSNRIRFDDFLGSLSQAYRLDAIQIDRRSLIASSEQRFAGGANASIYARGMLVAFICDIAIIRDSKGKRSVDDLVRDIYQRALAGKPQSGNDLILGTMRSRPELGMIVDKYITGSGPVDSRSDLAAAGIVVDGIGSAISLRVSAKPDGRQRDLLDKLGYNNWRKLSASSK
ncbi:MAG: hypothetical protein ABJA02_05165 [Acidobacteriota bacterium]